MVQRLPLINPLVTQDVARVQLPCKNRLMNGIVLLMVLVLAACGQNEPVNLRYEDDPREVIQQAIRETYPDYTAVSTAARCIGKAMNDRHRSALADTSGAMTHEDKKAVAMSYFNDENTQFCLRKNKVPLLSS